MFRANYRHWLKREFKKGPLYLRLDYIRAPRRRMNFIPLSIQKYVQMTRTLWAHGIDSEAIGTGRRWRFRNRRTNR